VAAVTNSAYAESLAITNATVHTVTEQGVLNNATVVIENGKIIAINPETVNADTVIDAQGKILTPGLIGSMNTLGLVEVGAVSRTRDAGEKKADITFDASLAFNPMSTLIPYTRKGGITRNVVAPRGGDDMFKGQTFVVDLSGSFDSVKQRGSGVYIDLGAKSKGSRAFELQALSNKFEDAQEKLTKAKKKTADAKKNDKDKTEFKRDEKIINELLAGTKPLFAYADRATDLLALINLKKRFNINLVLLGAADASLITEQLVAADVPVVFDAMRNLPGSFDSLHLSLATAGELTAAGVKVVLSSGGDAHNSYQLRFDAGNAIANGMPKAIALATITANAAGVYNIDAGRIEVGKVADLVLWSADPFELSTTVDKMWIGGNEMSTQSRQDELRKRYTTASDMPRAYTK
jgi:imidazolonepropionase-like amidohydrolase